MLRDPALRWIPLLASAALIQPAYAVVYMSVEQAQKLMFAAETMTAVPVVLSASDVATVESRTGTRYLPGSVRAWKADSGWFFVDAVVGKHDLITYAAAVGHDGKLRQVEILEYREAYGGEVRNAAWLHQFEGRSAADPVRVGADIQNISGATFSCRHVTEGIRRLLAIHELLASAR